MSSTAFVGQRVKRVEDPDLLTGRGQFLDDLKLPGLLEAAFVRSPFAHATFTEIDAAEARAMPGVVAVLTARDLPAEMLDKRILLQVPHPEITYAVTQEPLATSEVCFVGEAVAVVIAESRHLAEDAAERVIVDWEPLPATAHCDAALKPGAPAVHSTMTDNIAGRLNLSFGDVDAAFRNAAHVIRERYEPHRGTGHPMECRGVVAVYDLVSDAFRIWSSTQTPHNTQRAVIDMFGLAEDHVRVITPDVGGGFGPKNQVYPEELVIPAAARLLGRPVKWAEDRREHFLTTTQERDQVWDVAAAVDDDGRLLGIKGTLIHDAGAYLPWGIIMPYISATTLPGPYKLPAYRMAVTIAFTNLVPTTPLRGAGRPQAVFAMERLLDAVAAKLGLDPAEVRRRNFIQASDMPYDMGLTYRDGAPVMYDTGDYPDAQAKALAAAGYDDFPARQKAALAQGRHIGIGIGNYVEGTGLGPFEGATIRILTNGRVAIYTGAAAAGQAHRTTLAQICADELNIDVTDIDVVGGDTGVMPRGAGTYASRITVNAGSSTRMAATELRGKALALAAAKFDVKPEDVELTHGAVRIKGEQGDSITFEELAKMTSGMPGYALPKGVKPDLEASGYFTPPQATYSNGSHVAEVEVDPETGQVTILKYTVVHDCGTIINPMLVDGQVQGGVAHGIGNALLERMVFDADANPLTTTFADYLMPTAEIVPTCDIVHMESPTPLNPLGAKGAGEGGTIPAPAAIVAAVENALSPFGIRITDCPITPQRIVELINAASETNQEDR
ncbi:MAG TPA: dehydrogenase [Rhodospirillaceae bacterium]|nr:dehydrogenase [Rhodospirillaceae bacterium]